MTRSEYTKPDPRPIAGLVGGFIALISVLSCGDLQPTGSETRATEVSTVDSAGVVVVTLEQSLWDKEPRRLLPTRVLVDAADSTSPPLFAVTGAIPMDNGTSVLANAGSHQILWLGAEGELVRSMGGEGEGPGEFGNIGGISLCDGRQRLAVREYDRITVLELDGRLVAARPIVPRTPDGGLWIFDPIGDCGRILVGPTKSEPPPTVGLTRSLQMSLAWLDEDATLTQLMPPFRWVTQFGGELQGRPVPLVQPWSPMAVWATAGNRLVFGTGSDPELYWRELDGTISRIVRWQEQARAIGAQDRAAYARARENYLEGRPPHEGEIIASLDVAPIPDSLPLYDKLLVDAVGDVWLRRYPRDAAGRPDIGWGGYDGAEEWAVLPTTGQAPTSIRLPPRHQLMSVGMRELVTVSFDSLDRESVNLFDRAQVLPPN